MSFKSIFTNVIKPLLDNATPETVETAVLNLYETLHPNGTGKQSQGSTASTRKKAVKRQSASTKSKVSTLAVSEWLCVKECAKAIGSTIKDIKYLIEQEKLDVIVWNERTPCVHRRQVALYLDKQEHLDLDDCLDIKLDWATMNAVVIALGLGSSSVYRAVEKGELADHRAGKHCRLVNIAECEAYFVEGN